MAPVKKKYTTDMPAAQDLAAMSKGAVVDTLFFRKNTDFPEKTLKVHIITQKTYGNLHFFSLPVLDLKADLVYHEYEPI